MSIPTTQESLAFEQRFGRTPCGWRRHLAPYGVSYTRAGLRVTCLLADAGADGRKAFTVTVARMGTSRSHPEIDELFEIRSAFLPADVPVRLEWVWLGARRVPTLVGFVEAVDAQSEADRTVRRAG